MAHWSDSLVALRAAQPPATTTVTRTGDALAALASGPRPASVSRRSSWHRWTAQALPQPLRAAGWWVVPVERRDAATTITFIRYELTPWGSRPRQNSP